MGFSTPTYGAAVSKVKGVASGLVSATLNADKTEFTYTYADGTVLTVPVTQPPLDVELVKSETDRATEAWLIENKADIKGEKGDGVQILSEEETESDIRPETVVAYRFAEVEDADASYTKTQSDVRFAKTYEVGDVTKLAVSTWDDLVSAINWVYGAGAGEFRFKADTKSLEIVTRAGQIINIDVSQIILSTSITEFRDMLILNIKDGESLVWSDTKKKFVNKAVDSSAVFEQAKAYTDEKVTKMTDADAIACEEEPTYYGGVVTYKKGGETLQMEVTGKKVFFYYYDADGNATQKIWVDGTPFVISMGGDFDLTDYVKEEKVLDTYDDTFTDLEKIPNAKYIKEFADALKEEIGGDASSITYEFDTHPEWKTVKNALDGIINKIEYVKPSITSFTATPSTTVYEKGKKVASLIFNWVLNKAVSIQTLTGCTVTAEDRTATYSTEISSKKTFTLSVSDGENSASSNFTVDFQNKIYSGSASEGTYNSAFVLGLSNSKFATAKAGTYSVNVASGQYGYIAYPKSMGQISSVKIGGFDTDMVNCGDIQFTNASGYTETYNIVRTGRSGLGSISMVVS